LTKDGFFTDFQARQSRHCRSKLKPGCVVFDESRLASYAWEREYLRSIWENLPDVNATVAHWWPDRPFEAVVADPTTLLVVVSDEVARVPPPLDCRGVVKQYVHPADRRSFAIPLGTRNGFPAIRPRPITDRAIDVTFIGSPWRHRQLLITWLRDHSQLRNLKLRFELSANLSIAEYADALNSTKVSLCLAGRMNVETFRFFESMAGGCIAITPRYPENPVYLSGPQLVAEEPNQIVNAIIAILEDRNQMRAVHEASIAAWNNRYSPTAVAAQIRNAFGQ
jgi:hypothetical protein